MACVLRACVKGVRVRVQYSGVHTASGRVASGPGPGVARLCGQRVLSNSAVNALSAAATALAGGALGLLLRASGGAA